MSCVQNGIQHLLRHKYLGLHCAILKVSNKDWQRSELNIRRWLVEAGECSVKRYRKQPVLEDRLSDECRVDLYLHWWDRYVLTFINDKLI